MRAKIGSAAAIASLLLAGGTAQAAPVYDSNGFDNTTRFPTGVLEGKDSGKWQKAFADGSAVVQNSVALSAAQAVLVTHGAGDNYWFPSTPAITPLGSTNLVTVDWDFRIPSGATNNPVYGIEVFDQDGSTVAMIGLDATTGGLYTRNPSFSLVNLGTSFTASKDTWYHFQLKLDYASQKYTTTVDNVAKDSNRSFLSLSSTFSDADILASGVSAGATTGSAYIDNYAVNAVPEPGTAGALGLAVAGLLSTRRRHRRGRSSEAAKAL